MKYQLIIESAGIQYVSVMKANTELGLQGIIKRLKTNPANSHKKYSIVTIQEARKIEELQFLTKRREEKMKKKSGAAKGKYKIDIVKLMSFRDEKMKETGMHITIDKAYKMYMKEADL